MAAIAAIVAATAAVVGTAVSATAQAKAAEESAEVQAAASFDRRQTNIRKRIRERRILEGRIRNQAVQQGTGGSSGEAGALSSLATQFASGTSADLFAESSSKRLGDIQTKATKQVGVGNLISSFGSAAMAYAGAQQKADADTIPKV